MTDNEVKQILKESKTVAVVGLSPDPERDSNSVASYLKQKGYKIIPVNPKEKEILGEKVYASLKDVPEKVDIVDIFRKAEFVPDIVDDAIGIGAKTVWMQLSIESPEGAQKAQKAGLKVVENRCIMQDHRRLMGQ